MATRLTTSASAPVEDDAQTTAQIDTAPISPDDASANLEKARASCRSVWAEQLLAQRSEPQELKDKNILKAGGTLAAQREALERSMIGDKLSSSLERRPTADELVKEGILNPDEAPPVNADPTAIQGDAPAVTPTN